MDNSALQNCIDKILEQRKEYSKAYLSYDLRGKGTKSSSKKPVDEIEEYKALLKTNPQQADIHPGKIALQIQEAKESLIDCLNNQYTVKQIRLLTDQGIIVKKDLESILKL